MSSLPPYNPRLGHDAVWFLPVTNPAELPPALPPSPSGWAAAVVDDHAMAAPAFDLCSGCEVKVISGAAAIDIPADGWSVVIGTPTFVERALRWVMRMPDGTARFVVVPGALSVVQLLPGRAILVHLNQEHALDIPQV